MEELSKSSSDNVLLTNLYHVHLQALNLHNVDKNDNIDRQELQAALDDVSKTFVFTCDNMSTYITVVYK